MINFDRDVYWWNNGSIVNVKIIECVSNKWILYKVTCGGRAGASPEWTVSTAPSVCVLGWVKCREHISLLVILCIIVYVTNYNIYFLNRYPIMVKCLNIGRSLAVTGSLQPCHRRLCIATGGSARDVTHCWCITSIIQSFVNKCNDSNSCKLLYLDYKSMLIHKLLGMHWMFGNRNCSAENRKKKLFRCLAE